MTPAKSPDAPAGPGSELSGNGEIAVAEIAGTEMPGTEIADVEVEEVSSVSVTPVTRVTEPTAHSTGIWQFPDDFLDGDTPPGDAPEAAPVRTDVASVAPAAEPRVRRKPPKNHGERLLGFLIAVALAILLALAAYLFFLAAPENYAALREKLPAEWTFPPPAESRKENPPPEDSVDRKNEIMQNPNED